ncbi:unnamed protein product [Moneuplotes crassus]|uniref:Uncharacterized protein n=1 Tax=Euplotes crassus TaxID=5936 RepID=A0AAD1U7M4_EUPCR|nr:unnamed protein product [Moneuplotes crassus]
MSNLKRVFTFCIKPKPNTKCSNDKIGIDCSLETLSTDYSEFSSSPAKSIIMDPAVSDLASRVRICLLNEVLPDNQKRELPSQSLSLKKTNSACPRVSKFSWDFSNSSRENIKAISVPRLAYCSTNRERSKNDEHPKKASFAKRIEAFNSLQKLAYNIRQDDEVIFGEEKPFEYLKEIQDYQNEYKTATKTKKYDSRSVRMNKISSSKTLAFSTRTKAKPQKPRNLNIVEAQAEEVKVSHKVLSGLDSIIKNFKLSSKISKLSKKKSSNKTKYQPKKSKCIGTLKGPLGEPCLTHIPVGHLQKIVASLSQL